MEAKAQFKKISVRYYRDPDFPDRDSGDKLTTVVEYNTDYLIENIGGDEIWIDKTTDLSMLIRIIEQIQQCQ